MGINMRKIIILFFVSVSLLVLGVMVQRNFQKTTSSNRLGKEKSPYLLQHKDNPVAWYAWGEEAFEAARAQNKPIFLSIGYSTCLWCQVMKKNSFEAQEVALA